MFKFKITPIIVSLIFGFIAAAMFPMSWTNSTRIYFTEAEYLPQENGDIVVWGVSNFMLHDETSCLMKMLQQLQVAKNYSDEDIKTLFANFHKHMGGDNVAVYRISNNYILLREIY